MPLPETRRQQLDNIVKQMLSNKESDKNIQAVVNDFVSKYQNESISQNSQKVDTFLGIKQGSESLPAKLSLALTTSERGLGKTFGGALATGSQEVKNAQESQVKLDAMNQQLIDKIKQVDALGGDSSRLRDRLRQNMGQSFDIATVIPETQKTAGQIYGEGLGTALDAISAGSYGGAVKGAETGKLLLNSEKVVAPVVKKALGETLKNIGVNTAKKAAIGAATGYGYDVSQNLQSGKEGGEAFKPGTGTLMGGLVPTIIGGVQAGVAITKDTAPRFINSLIKPSKANFSYGKDPGRTVSELGITGNSLPDFGRNIDKAKQEIGSEIGSIYSSPENANLRIDVSPEISKIDEAIQEAAKGGKQNQAVVTALQNTKDALLYEHAVNADGVIEKIGTTPRDLTNLSPQEAFDLKQLVSGQTKFTGNPTDDKTVNAVLKDVYGGIKGKLNKAVEQNNPEILDLNQKYADLTSADLAIRNRDMIVKRSSMVSMPVKVGTATALISSIVSGGASIPILLAGATAGVLDKALESTAVKTRIASWLGKAEPGVINKLIQQNPGLKTIFYRLVPKLGSRIGK